MDLLLKGVFACLFLNFCYLNAIWLIYSRNNDETKITDRLNHIEAPIDFTYELENENILLFSDILLMNNNNKLEFKVHHKSTNKNEQIHIYSYHHWSSRLVGVGTAEYTDCLSAKG